MLVLFLKEVCMKRLLLTFVVLIVGFCAATSNADLKRTLDEQSDNRQIALEMGIAYHNEGLNGDKNSVQKAITLLSTLVDDDMEGLATAYLGSSHLLRARDDWNPFGKLSNLNKGYEYLDKAVKEHPDYILIRIIRGNAYMNIPTIFGKLDTAISDFERVIELWPLESEVDEIILTVRLRLGESLMKKGDSDGAYYHWRWVIRKAPDSPQADLAKELLRP